MKLTRSMSLFIWLLSPFEKRLGQGPSLALDAFCQVWFWRRRILNFVNVFSLFHNYLPLEKGRALRLNKLESPSPKNALCQFWLKLVQWFWRKRWKCEKFTTTSHNRQILITWAFYSGELKIAWDFSSGELKCEKLVPTLSNTVQDKSNFTWIKKNHWRLKLRWAKNQQ